MSQTPNPPGRHLRNDRTLSTSTRASAADPLSTSATSPEECLFVALARHRAHAWLVEQQQQKSHLPPPPLALPRPASPPADVGHATWHWRVPAGHGDVVDAAFEIRNARDWEHARDAAAAAAASVLPRYAGASAAWPGWAVG
ncbi:hypothetical protein AMAG_19527 [Allomyces macrogynus ATCC 38327]|uniref:Uncharacterized protein n=1 Tax=Allomyces macrogynus (strain ATCC 38327) TaxID=578462 RepID=A0A0L0SWD2_ALLM3|nr:hypothetical protein AMAG_19527 [Allomyces macrogynus ATCC 38327]|eukprot:KNE66817.1 hypothetical protein AMAG_19527 [Allomyces macrogynus ATCC 38327]